MNPNEAPCTPIAMENIPNFSAVPATKVAAEAKAFAKTKPISGLDSLS